MLSLVKNTKLILEGSPAVFCLLLASVLALLPISAQAQCAKWDANGSLKIVQRGQLPFDVTLEQKGRALTGTADAILLSEGKRLKGPVDGEIDGDSFRIQIFWNNYTIGVYTGKVLATGRLDGEAYEKNTPNVRLTWYSEGVLKCPPPPPVIPKPIRSSGKAKPAPAPTPPFITASQPIIPTPGHPLGIVVLGWEGGPDHPSVEVFVSIDNGAEIAAFSTEHSPQSPVWKQPKMASIQLNLQRYHHYRFVLKAAGKTLSTAAFVVP